MIPKSHLQEWSITAPWPDPRQVEQDLIICRALCDLFNEPFLASRIAFRGGTAINKLLFQKPLRYSEDIDLVQTDAEPIGPTIDAIRRALSWLGKCNRKQAGHSMHLVFKFNPEVDPEANLKIKVEINTREHKSLFGIKRYRFKVVSDWYMAETEIASFEAEEVFGTKLRALLQRRKNRDLYDLNEGLTQLNMDGAKLIACFEHYLALEGTPIGRAAAEQRMLEKLDRSLTEDIAPLLPAGVHYTDGDAISAFEKVWRDLIINIKGDPWRLTESALEEIRTTKIPGFLTNSSK